MSNIVRPRIIRSRRLTLSLQITKDGELIVNAPFFMLPRDINNYLHEKEDWIKESIAKIKQRQQKKRTDAEEETFLYLGNTYTLKIFSGISIKMDENTLHFPSILVFRKKKEITDWYIRQARNVITERVHFHSQKMNTTYTSIVFSDTKSKWGTCGPNNDLQFSWRLIMAPLLILDYVVIHELAHTKEKNHSRSFWSFVRLYTPAYRQHRNWLNENGYLLQREI